MRQARGDRSAMPPEFVDMVWEHWDAGMQAAILALYRDADPDKLAVAGRDLGRLECPALVLWGDRDPYLALDRRPRPDRPRQRVPRLALE